MTPDDYDRLAAIGQAAADDPFPGWLYDDPPLTPREIATRIASQESDHAEREAIRRYTGPHTENCLDYRELCEADRVCAGGCQEPVVAVPVDELPF